RDLEDLQAEGDFITAFFELGGQEATLPEVLFGAGNLAQHGIVFRLKRLALSIFRSLAFQDRLRLSLQTGFRSVESGFRPYHRRMGVSIVYLQALQIDV